MVQIGGSGTRTYRLYGFFVSCPWELACPRAPRGESPDIRFTVDDGRDFSEAPQDTGEWMQHHTLEDGSDFLRWRELAEFLVSPDGRTIVGRPLDGASLEAFSVYALGPALSFALLKLGVEPIHADVNVVEGSAIGLLAQPGGGKSTLAAAFLRRGHRLLTDDLLVLKQVEGAHWAQSGLPRVKLLPEVADALMGGDAHRARMHPLTRKLIVPIPRDMFHQEEAPLDRLYVLRRGHGTRVTMRRLSEPQAYLRLTEHTFNTKVTLPGRLEGQFRFATELARSVPVVSLSYPWDVERLQEVVDAVERDLR